MTYLVIRPITAIATIVNGINNIFQPNTDIDNAMVNNNIVINKPASKFAKVKIC